MTAAEVVYEITSLTQNRADAARLLGLVRAHQGIENGSHHVRNATSPEDACRVRSGSAPRVLASLRDVAVYLLHQMDDVPSIAAATRRVAANPTVVLPWLGIPDPTTE